MRIFSFEIHETECFSTRGSTFFLAPLEKHGKASISVPEGVASPLQKVRFCPPSPDKRATQKSWRGHFHDMMEYVGGDIMGISVEIHSIYSIVCPMGISTLFFWECLIDPGMDPDSCLPIAAIAPMLCLV